MEKVIAVVMGSVFVVALSLGVYWLLWTLWCWVVPQIWAAGPENLIRPDYWLFAGAWCLVSLVGKSIFGRNK